VKLSNYILDLGRIVAYYPNLKKITYSTTASILLCQLLYWCDKTRDDWIWKTSDDIEEETGLTYNEQRTARKSLVDLGIVTEEYKRLDHMYRFRVNQEILNTMWEDYTGKKSEAVTEKKSNKNTGKGHVYKKKTPVVSKTVVKKTEMTAAEKAGISEEKAKLFDIREEIERRLNVTADNPRWEKFIEFVNDRQENYKQPIGKFIDWALEEGFNPIYWTPEKMKTVYPQAFAKKEEANSDDNFVEKLPERKIKKYAPMPKDIGRKKDLF